MFKRWQWYAFSAICLGAVGFAIYDGEEQIMGYSMGILWLVVSGIWAYKEGI